ncbi:MAG: M20/M25/M40 family metallo-hydrolase [Oligoflexia bacterium]|nr:M20/M25/M40 family metallo-hydrolase [Oligoflexia bacterium]
MAEFAADLCRQWGFDVHLQKAEFDGKKQYNLYARPPASKKRDEVIFQTHLDTVEPGPMGNWTKTDHNPFKAHVDGDFIYGLGPADVKLDFLCKARALKEFVAQKQTRPFVLVGTYAEELGMHGARLVMSSGAVHAKWAIIGEPSELSIVYGNNGYLVCRFEIPFTSEEMNNLRGARRDDHHTTQEKVFHGKAAHSATPHLGESAINKALQYLAKMPRGVGLLSISGGSAVNTVPADATLEMDAGHVFKEAASIKLLELFRALNRLETEFLSHEYKEFHPPHPTLNLGIVRTDEQKIWGRFSVRITPQIDDSTVKNWTGRVEELCKSQKIQFFIERSSPAALTPTASELITTAIGISKQLGLSETPITKASGTECSIYRPHGLDCFVFGPGVSLGNSHTANERNQLSHLEKATDFYRECVKRFCL